MRYRFILLLVVAAASVTDAVAASPGTDSEAVKGVVNDWVRVWESKDMALLSRIMAHDPDIVLFGTDPEEHFVGWDSLRAYVGKLFPAMQDAKLTVKDQVIKVYQGSRVASFTELVSWDYAYNGKPVHQDCRFSGVLEKRHGHWVFVQFHNSVPAGS